MTNLSHLAAQLIRDTDSGDRSQAGFAPKRQLYTHEQYLYDVFLAMGELDTLMKQLQQSVVMLASYRTTKSLKKHKIDRFQHIIYHIESHLLRITGALDRLLILVNQVLRLGLDTFSCKSHYMLHDRKLKKGKSAPKIEAIPGLFEALIAVKDFVDKFRDDRNDIAHSNRINYEDLRQVEMFHIVFAEATDPYFLKRKHIVKTQTDQKVWQYKAEMDSSNRQLKLLIENVYDILETQFDQHFKKLEGHSSL